MHSSTLNFMLLLFRKRCYTPFSIYQDSYLAPRLGGIKQKKCIIHCWASAYQLSMNFNLSELVYWTIFFQMSRHCKAWWIDDKQIFGLSFICFCSGKYTSSPLTRTLRGNEKQFKIASIQVIRVDWIFIFAISILVVYWYFSTSVYSRVKINLSHQKL